MSNLTTVHHLIKMFESLDVPGSLGYFTDDAVYRFGNYPAATGKEAIAATIKASHLDQITRIAFEIKSTHEQGDAVVVELAINYTMVGGKAPKRSSAGASTRAPAAKQSPKSKSPAAPKAVALASAAD